MGKMQTTVFLVRHGETDNNYSTNHSIDSKRQLTINGRNQAKLIGQYLTQFQPAIIYSSPLDRCLDTAQIIQSQIGLENEIIQTNSLLEIYSNEPRSTAGERGRSIFEEIIHEYKGEQVVAVTHQYIIGYIVAALWGVDFWDVPCKFADVYRLVFAENTLVEANRLQPANKSSNR